MPDTPRRRLTRRQRLGLVGLTAAFAAALATLFIVTRPNYPGLPALLSPLIWSSPPPVEEAALPHAAPSATPDGPAISPSSTWYNNLATPGLAEEAGPTSTPTAYFEYLPSIGLQPTEVPHVVFGLGFVTEPPPVPPTPKWPDGLSALTNSKLGIHAVSNNDPYIMEFVRRVRPRVVKAVNDVGWLSDVKKFSPNTITIGRFTDQDESPLLVEDPAQAADEYIASQLDRYRLNPGADFWEGWNEFVPVNPARMTWYAQFEAHRACAMQALGLRAAVGGFSVGVPEWSEMILFLPALEAAYRCGGIFTLHEYNSPTFACGVGPSVAGQIPGAPDLGDKPMGYLTLRYRFWYEGLLKPRGMGDLPLVISELGLANIQTDPNCHDPGGEGWKAYQQWWVQNGIGPDGPQAYVNVLAWYDQQMRQDDYVWGATIFTAGARYAGAWNSMDIHDVMVPLAYYLASQK